MADRSKTTDQYDEKAESLWQEVLRFRSRVVGGYDIPDDWAPPKEAIARALREAHAAGLEEAAKILSDGLSEECGCSAELKSQCRTRAAALRGQEAKP